MVVAVQQAQLREHGGLVGARNEVLLESVLAKVAVELRQRVHSDLAAAAAAYAYGLARNVCFVDGNKRTAFASMCVFLGLNGYVIAAPEAEVVYMIRGIAVGRVSEAELAEWLRRVMIAAP